MVEWRHGELLGYMGKGLFGSLCVLTLDSSYDYNSCLCWACTI